jgi:hypothetical protein
MISVLLIMGFVLIGALSNNASLFTIGLIVLFGYAIFSFSNRKSITEITKPKATSESALDILNKVKLHEPEGMLDNMLKDLGKATAGAMKGKAEINAKTLLKPTYKVVKDIEKVIPQGRE